MGANISKISFKFIATRRPRPRGTERSQSPECGLVGPEFKLMHGVSQTAFCHPRPRRVELVDLGLLTTSRGGAPCGSWAGKKPMRGVPEFERSNFRSPIFDFRSSKISTPLEGPQNTSFWTISGSVATRAILVMSLRIECINRDVI